MVNPTPIAPAPGAQEISTRRVPQPPVPTRLGASKTWVLPPRPKPGRKPKAKPQPRVVVNKTGRKHPLDDDECGLCGDEGGCLCSAMGMKDHIKGGAKKSHAPEVVPIGPTVKLDFEKFEPAAAVPLRRAPSTLAPANDKPRKFRRVADIMPISVIAQAPEFEVKLTPTDSCGFCNDNTPCLCAEDVVDHPKAEVKVHQVPKLESRSHTPILPQPTHVESQIAVSDREIEITSASIQPPNLNAAGLKAGRSSLADSATLPPPHVNGNTEAIDYGCSACQKDPMSMLFCLSLGSAQPLDPNSVSIPCIMAFKTIEKHPRFSECDLGQLVHMLESANKMIGVQSINRALQYLSSGGK